MKIGDKIEWSSKNKNHLGNDVCAYAGFAGVVYEISEDGSFSIKGDQGILIVPRCGHFGRRSVWIILNGKLIKYRFKKYQVWYKELLRFIF